MVLPLCKNTGIVTQTLLYRSVGGKDPCRELVVAALLGRRERRKVDLELVAIWPEHVYLEHRLRAAVPYGIKQHKVAWVAVIVKIHSVGMHHRPDAAFRRA